MAKVSSPAFFLRGLHPMSPQQEVRSWLPLFPTHCLHSGQKGWWGCLVRTVRGSPVGQGWGHEAKTVPLPKRWWGPGGLKDVGLPLDPHVLEGVCLAVPVTGQGRSQVTVKAQTCLPSPAEVFLVPISEVTRAPNKEP